MTPWELYIVSCPSSGWLKQQIVTMKFMRVISVGSPGCKNHWPGLKELLQNHGIVQTKATNGFSNPKVGRYLAYIPWDTLLLALVEGGVDWPNAVWRAVHAPCE